jgi:undecaprenyl-diphosphatase
MSWWQALLLGVVEGVTEYLPISSTGHLILTAWLLGLADDPERWAAAFAFNIVIQAGAIAAVALLYHRRLRRMAAGLLGRDDEGRRLAVLLGIAFLPAAVLGPLLDETIETRLNGPWPVAFALFAGAVLMLAVAWKRPGAGGRGLEAVDWRLALAVGAGQCLAMWPGTSRSMMTIVVGMLGGLAPAAAAELSFLLGLVTLTAATGYKLATGGAAVVAHFGVGALAIGFAAATVSAALAVRWFVGFLNRRGLAPFAWYRLALALLLAAALLGGALRVPDGRALDDLAHDLDQRRGLERLGQETRHVPAGGEVGRIALAVPAQEHDGDLGIQALQFVKRLRAVHPRHRHVEEHRPDLVAVLAEDSQGLVSVPGFEHHEAAGAEDRGHHQADHGLVVDDQQDSARSPVARRISPGVVVLFVRGQVLHCNSADVTARVRRASGRPPRVRLSEVLAGSYYTSAGIRHCAVTARQV